MTSNHQIIANRKGPQFHVGGDLLYLDVPAADAYTLKALHPGMVPWWGCRWNEGSHPKRGGFFHLWRRAKKERPQKLFWKRSAIL